MEAKEKKRIKTLAAVFAGTISGGILAAVVLSWLR